MIPVNQRYPADPTRTDGRSADGRLGDCLRCCIAAITELPYDQVPHVAEIEDWWGAWRTWSQEYAGVDVGILVPVDGSIAQFLDVDDPANVEVIACGPSPRRQPGDVRARHAVVVDGYLRLLHDPHPSRAGLPSVDEVYLFVPIKETAAQVGILTPG